MNTALIYHKDYLTHRYPFSHPERSERLSYCMDFLKKTKILEKVDLLTPEPADEKDLLRVHTQRHIDHIKDLCEKGGGSVDLDTYAGPDTYNIAKLAAGGVMLAGDYAITNKGSAFALIRPPGHHAYKNKGGGFCYFNNAAVMINYVMEKYSLNRVFLLDWDAHAFNGTADIFYSTSRVLNVSIHQDPHTFYPGTGFMSQIGEGAGKGYTVNIPVPSGTKDADYIHILNEFVIPLAYNFKPDLIVVSAGQDSHRDDYISGLQLTEEGYGAMTSMLKKAADELCGKRLVVELEGGYNLEALAKSNYEILRALLRISGFKRDFGGIKDTTQEILEELKDTFSSYHRI